jgi:hypothetical protein
VFADKITVDPENNLVSLHFTLHFCLVSQLSHDLSQLLKLPVKQSNKMSGLHVEVKVK